VPGYGSEAGFDGAELREVAGHGGPGHGVAAGDEQVGEIGFVEGGA